MERYSLMNGSSSSWRKSRDRSSIPSILMNVFLLENGIKLRSTYQILPRLMITCIHMQAEFLGLPFVPPFYGSNLEKGVNFAVGGATTVETSVLEEKGIIYPHSNVSLGVELTDFKENLSKFCGSPSDCRDMIENALILIGEIGGNEFSYASFVGKGIEETRELVPLVISYISSATSVNISLSEKWDQVEKHVSDFTKVDDNKYSIEI